MKTLDTPRTESVALVSVVVSYAPNGVLDPDPLSNKGNGFSVVRAGGAGLWDVTFDEAYAEFLGPGGWSIALNAPADLKLQFGAWDPVLRKLRVVCLAVAVATDIAANANNRITFTALFRNSEVKV